MPCPTRELAAATSLTRWSVRYLVAATLAHMSRCVIGVLPSHNGDASNTGGGTDVLTAWRAWHPWLLAGPVKRVDPSRGLKPRNATAVLRQHPELLQVVHALTRLERHVFGIAQQLASPQYAVATARDARSASPPAGSE